MSRLDELRAYTSGVRRARDAYREDRLRVEGRCVICTRQWNGSARVCDKCRQRKLRAAGVSPSTEGETRVVESATCGSVVAPLSTISDHFPMARIDGCPECARNTEPPKSAVRVIEAWRCAYLCSSCGHAWTTDWRD